VDRGALPTAPVITVTRPPSWLTRGLNRNHNRILKDVLKDAATAATARPGPLQDWYRRVLVAEVRADLARVTLARKTRGNHARFWKKGERVDVRVMVPA
jgi:hypothetical protein